jgi:uncharacterized membrane protein YeiB
MIKKRLKQFALFNFSTIILFCFSILGFVVLYFAIKFPKSVPFYGWVIIVLFAIVPLLLIYGLEHGSIWSKKQLKKIEDRRDKLIFNNEGITIEKPLLDKNCFVHWKSIEAIIYYNYIVYTDFTEYYHGYYLYLSTLSVYTKYKKQWWLNELFSNNAQSKIVNIKKDTKHFSELPNMLEKYLNITVENKNAMGEKCRPDINVPEQIVFTKFNSTIEEIKENYR